MLGLSQAILSALDNVESELNASLHQVSITFARIQETLNNTQANVTDMVHNSTTDVLAVAVKGLQSANNTSERAKFVRNELQQIEDDVGRSLIVLDELNITKKEVESVALKVTETTLVSVI